MSAGMHLLHLIITIIFIPWCVVWLVCAISASNKRKRKEDRSREEEIELLKSIELQMRRNK